MSDVVPMAGGDDDLVAAVDEDEEGLALGLLEIDLVFAFGQSLARVFRGLEQMNDWWAIRLHPEARTVLEPHPGGSWKQQWSSGGIWFGTVTQVDIPSRLRIRGPLLMAGLVDNILDVWLEEADGGGTLLHVHHQALGALDDDAQETYEQIWSDMFGHALGAFLDGR